MKLDWSHLSLRPYFLREFEQLCPKDSSYINTQVQDDVEDNLTVKLKKTMNQRTGGRKGEVALLGSSLFPREPDKKTSNSVDKNNFNNKQRRPRIK